MELQMERRGEVLVLDLGPGENRFTPEWTAAVEAAVEQVERATGPRALVTRGSGRFYSNGLEPHRLAAPDGDRRAHLASVHDLYARLLAAPFLTVAAVQGHAYGAGAMLALAHDVRVMRTDRGFWCLPEADLDLEFTPGMAALVQSRLDPRTARDAMLLARRWGGEQARDAGIVDATAAEEAVLDDAVAIAQEHAAKAGPALGATKRRMHAGALALLRADPLA